MKNTVKNVLLLVCIIGVLVLTGLFLTHDSEILMEIPQIDAQELAAQKEIVQQAERNAQRQAQLRRIYACQTDEDCIIVDKDPCGCFAGPKGVVAINVSRITEFNAVNNTRLVAKTCSEEISTEKECSSSAHPVCSARTCKIVY